MELRNQRNLIGDAGLPTDYFLLLLVKSSPSAKGGDSGFHPHCHMDESIREVSRSDWKMLFLRRVRLAAQPWAFCRTHGTPWSSLEEQRGHLSPGPEGHSQLPSLCGPVLHGPPSRLPVGTCFQKTRATGAAFLHLLHFFFLS